MKGNFKAPKKWLLASTLVALVAGNYSYAADDSLAKGTEKLKSKTIEVIAEDGETYEVNLSKVDEEKTAAIFPVQLQGQSCDAESCLNKITLGVSIDQDLKDLEKAFRKAVSKKKTAKIEEEVSVEKKEAEESTDDDQVKLKKPKKAKVEEDEDESDEELDEEISKEEARKEKIDKEFARLEKRCDIKSEEDEKSKCMTKGLMDLLKKKDLKMTKTEANKFFDEQISPDLKEFVKSQNDKFGYMDAASILRIVQSSAPKENNDLRKMAMLASLQGIQEFNQQRLSDMNYAQKNNDMVLFQEAVNRGSWMDSSLIPTLRQETNYGLSTAYNNKLIDLSTGRQLISAFDANVSALRQNNQLVPRGENSLMIISSNDFENSLLLDRRVQQLVPGNESFSSTRSLSPVDGSGRSARSLPGHSGFSGGQSMFSDGSGQGVAPGSVQFGTIRRANTGLLRN